MRTFLEELQAVSLPTVDADNRLIEALRAGRTPTDNGEVGVLLAAWRNACAARTGAAIS